MVTSGENKANPIIVSKVLSFYTKLSTAAPNVRDPNKKNWLCLTHPFFPSILLDQWDKKVLGLYRESRVRP